MIFTIAHETRHSIRIRTAASRFSAAEADVLRRCLGEMKGVTDVEVFRATGSVRITYEGDRDYILDRLKTFSYKNVELFAREEQERISHEEIAKRKLSPGVKRKLRRRLLLETAADVLQPEPVQVGYHIYQIVTLRNL